MSTIKRISIAILLIFFSLPGKSQNAIAYKIFPDSVTDCRELQYQSMQLIPLFYTNRDFDTANAILNYWAANCQLDETIFRSRILFAIDAGTFSDSLFKNTDFTYYLDVYKELSEDTAGISLLKYPYYYVEEFPLLKWYKTFTDSIAERCSNYPDLSPEEYFFVNYYLHPADSSYEMIRSKPFNNTTLKSIVTSPKYGELAITQAHYALGTGMWMPNQHLATLGMHPYLGGQLGLRNGKYLADLALDLRMGASPNKYQVMIDGNPTDTEQFFGISFRLDFGYEVLELRGTELYFTGGIGYDGITAYYETNNPDDESDDVKKHLNSFNLNLGGSYRIYLKNDHYLAFSGRYHRLNFRNKGGTDLKGNAVSIGLEYGLGTNQWLNNRNTILREKTGRN
ncbi:MAG TPA: hypothetical protein PK796_08720 [Bacteroidales bacterium]|jgi:hypothetical protein|nr:hypothetical protein [Bacteroidales bacterium]